jgi:cytochrome c556
MAGLRADMIRLNERLWTGDFRGVAAAAESVAEHPEVSPAERVRVQSALGDEFPDFVAADRHVHHLALQLREAALREDTAEVLTSLSALQTGCIACHTAFRERLTP